MGNKARDRLLTSRASTAAEQPALELADVQVRSDSWGTLLHASALWTGRARAPMFMSCEVELLDAAGKVVKRIPLSLPTDEGAKGAISPPPDLPRTNAVRARALSYYGSGSDRTWYKQQLDSGGVSVESQRDGVVHEILEERRIKAGDARANCERPEVTHQ